MACTGEIHLYDIGTQFLLTIYECINDISTPLDVSGASTLEIKFRKPSGVVVTKTATLYTDGTDGIIQYITVANDLDELGSWKVQAVVAFGGTGTWSSSIEKFKVLANLVTA